MTTIGKLRKIPSESESAFEWNIENFSTLSTDENKLYKSPQFAFAGNTWDLKLYPNGQKHTRTGEIDLVLCRIHPDNPISVEFSLVIKTADEKTDLVSYFSRVFEGYDSGWGDANLLKRSVILENISEFAPDDVFTIICTLKFLEPGVSISGDAKTEDCQYCGKSLKVEDISFHERRCLEKPVKCPECCDVVKLRCWYKHVCQRGKVKVRQEMFDYFKDIMISGEHSDTVIQVREVEFRLHRNILAARNPFFKAMFTNEMKEKATGVVTIDDCEPNLFRLFVHFLYTCKIEGLSQENVCGLYEIADKYQDERLKEKCLNFMINTISVETFCKFITLALKFNDEVLLEKAVNFFISRAKDIIIDETWHSFTKEYPKKVNELFIKALDNVVKLH